MRETSRRTSRGTGGTMEENWKETVGEAAGFSITRHIKITKI